MKITLDIQTLNHHFGLVSPVVRDKHLVPAYHYAYLGPLDGRLCLIGTDGEVEILSVIGDSVKVEGADGRLPVLLPVRKILDAARHQGKNTEVIMDFEAAGEGLFRLTFSGSSDRYDLRLGEGAEYYERISFQTEQAYAYNAPMDFFKSALQRGRHAMAKQDMRMYLNGMLMEVKQGCLSMVSTDGHRIVWSRVSEDTTTDDDSVQRHIMTRHCVEELSNFLSQDVAKSEMLTLSFTARAVRVDFGEIVFTGKLINESYPDYERVIPNNEERTREAVLDREELVSIMVRTVVIGEPAITLEFDGDMLKSASANNINERALVSIKAIQAPKESFSVTFNAEYLKELLNVMQGERVYMTFGASYKEGAYIEEQDAEGHTNEEVCYVLMPMNK